MAIPDQDILVLLRDTCRNLEDPQSLARFAERSGWSPFHLHREFHRVTGETPKKYTRRLRLERAAAALAASDASILEIALAAGFASHEVFTRSFTQHFGRSPRAYRKHALATATPDQRHRHQTLVRTVSPCVGLFHIDNRPHTGRSTAMTTKNIHCVTLDEQPILYIRRQVEQSALQPLFAECFPKLFAHGMQHGLAITGNPIARYVDLGPGLWTVDCIIPLGQEAEPGDGMDKGTLAGGNVVKGSHFGPYEELDKAYVAMQKWMQDQGLKAGGPHWEQYVTDPGEEPEPSKWQTDVYWPVG